MHVINSIKQVTKILVILLFVFSASYGNTALAGTPVVQTYYVPITEPQARTWMNAQTTTTENDTIHSVISITGTYNGSTVYYDHWEDGYEDDATNPQQSTTQVITINSGQVITFEDDIPVANGIRDQGNLYNDGMDKISATQQIVVTRALWPNGAPQAIGTQMAGAIEVFETSKWGNSFEVPVGIDNGQVSFNYTAVSIIAQKNGTSVTVQNRDLSVNVTQTLNEGQTLYVGGIRVGAIVASTGGPVQVDLLTAHQPSAYDGRLYSLLPTSGLGNTYYSPVSTTREGGGAMVYNNLIAYNPNSTTIQVNITCMTGTTGCPASQSLAAHTARFFQLPLSPTSPNTLTGARLSSTGGENFYALAAIDINSTVHNWGFNMVPETSLTTSVVVGWSPGTTDLARDANPIWVTPVATTTIYVDYDGNPATGPIVDSLGNQCDVSINVTALEAQKIFAPSSTNYDHSGWRVYTTDNTRIAVVYGQDGGSSSANQPTELDLGTAVLPFPSLVAYKSAALIGDFNNNGGIDPGELLEYTIKVHNSGIVPIANINLLDALDANTTYVADTTKMDGVLINDNSSDPRFPLGGTGYNLASTLQPGQDIIFTFQATVKNPLTPTNTSEIINSAKVASVAEIFLNARTSLVQQGILTVEKTSSASPNSVKPGDSITYTVTVTNTSLSTPQTGIQVTDSLPDGTDYVLQSTSVTGHRQKLVKDKFNNLLYTNNDGPENWAVSWSESDVAQNPAAGNVQVTNGTLRLTATNSWASRAVNLTTGITGQNFSSATLTFDFRTSPAVVAGDTVLVQAYGNGHGWTTLPSGTLNGFIGQISDLRSYDISTYIGTDTAVRFSVSSGYTGASDFFYVDNVAIKTNELPVSVTKDNIPGATYPDLISGVPPTLVRQDDGFALAAGENMTITYRVTVKTPVNETRIVNTATATSYEKAPPASYTTIDPVNTGGVIGDLVWLDTIVNGTYDYGEPGLYNVRVWLDTNNNDVFDSGVDFETRTGTDGKYVFDGLLPGTYKVFVDDSTVPTGLSYTTGTVNPSSSIIITGQESILNTDFGYKTANSGVAIIGNYIWSDANNNGVQDSGEVGVGGVTVELRTSPGGAVIATTSTNAFGIFLFTNVAPGTYTVTVTDTANKLTGYTSTTGTQSLGKGVGVPSDPLTVTGGNSYMMMDFGFYNSSLFSISNKLWFDSNNNASLDTGEPGIKDVTITLLDSNGNVTGSSLSDVNGNFSFTGVPNGSYTIKIEDATGKLIGYAGTTPAAQAGSLAVTVSGSNVSGTAFGYNAPGKIGDRVWIDLNSNRVQETGEAGIPGVTVVLYKDTNGNGVFDPPVDQLLATTTTGTDGDYMFQVTEAGRFFISIDNTQPSLSGFTLTTQDDEPYAGAQFQVDFLNLTTSFLAADFGYNSSSLIGLIGGTVWDDTNRNAVRNAGETGIGNVSVKLYKDTDTNNILDPAVDQLISTKLTDFNGDYAFDVSGTGTGRYFVSIDNYQTPLLGKILTTNDDQTYQGSQLTVNYLYPNNSFLDIDFGYAAPASSALTVTKAANPSGNVSPGSIITYTVTVANTTATRQTGIRVDDPLPANTTYVANSTSATGPLPPSTSTISDNFETGNYSGGSGWAGIWAEIGDDTNPANGDVRVETNLGDYSARIRQTNNGLSRPVNLSACTSATMTFDYRRVGFDGASDYVAFSVNNGTSWNEVTRFAGPGTDNNYVASPAYNINSNTTQIRFLSSGLNNQDYFYFDNVQIVCNIPKTTQTKTNYVGTTNPLSNGVPANLVVPADSFILDQNDTLTVTFRVTVNNPLPPDVVNIINQATATSNESGPAIGSVTNLRPILQDLQVTKTIETISSPCMVGVCQVTYLVTVTNVGTNAETAVEVTDVLPTELTYLSNVPSQGSYNNTTGIWSVGNISSGNSATLRITARVTSDSSSIQNCASLTTSTPVDNNPANNTGCVSITPTGIVLADFSAYEENGRMVVKWTTASETNTAGFYLLRKDDIAGEYQRINNRLLPALLTSPQGGTYSLVDNSAAPDKSYSYILIEIQGKGKKNVYGPFTVQAGVPGFMENQSISKTLTPDPLLKQDRNLKSFSEKIDKYINRDGVLVITNNNSLNQGNTLNGGNLFSNYTKEARENLDSREVLLKAGKETGKSFIQVGKSGTSNSLIKIPIVQEGIYSLSASAISAILGESEQNVSRYIARNDISLNSQGQNVAYTTDRKNFSIMFYGHGLDSIYSDKNIYWLSKGRGLQMENTQGKGPSPIGGDLSFTETIHAEKDDIIVPVMFNDPEADYWFWDAVVSEDPEENSKSFTIQVNGVANSSSEATLTANLYGFTETEASPDHHAMIYLNDNLIGEDEWDDAKPHTVTIHFSQALLINGANTIKVKGVLNNGVPYSEFWIDSFDLTYERVYQAVNNTLKCRGDGNPVVTINGFTGPDILLFDITDSARPKTVNAATITGTNSLYSVSFNPLTTDTVYLAVLRGAVTTAIETGTYTPAGLKNKSNSADYIIITTPDLVSASQSLTKYRQAQGHLPKIIVLEDIMNEFNYGIYDPRAIRDFLYYAYHNWTKPPKYVVLAGNGTYDYKDNKDRGDNLIPTLMTDTTMGLYASDNIFAVFDGDPIPKMAIGRLPVLTAEELQNIIKKIISYERSSGKNVLMLADDPDDGGNFPDDSDALAALLPQGYTVDKIYLSQYPVAQAKSLLLEKINSGAVFLNYIGHAGPDRLAFEGLLTKDDITLMHNAGVPHVLTAVTCLAGQFAIPGFDSLSESLVLKKNGGSAAVWAPTGYSYNWLARILDEEFLKAAFGAPKTVMGTAILNAFREYNISGGQPFMINIYTLFGDPALKLR